MRIFGNWNHEGNNSQAPWSRLDNPLSLIVGLIFKLHEQLWTMAWLLTPHIYHWSGVLWCYIWLWCMNQNYYQDENQSSLPSHPSTAPAVLLKNTNNIIKLFDMYMSNSVLNLNWSSSIWIILSNDFHWK